MMNGPEKSDSAIVAMNPCEHGWATGCGVGGEGGAKWEHGPTAYVMDTELQ